MVREYAAGFEHMYGGTGAMGAIGATGVTGTGSGIGANMTHRRLDDGATNALTTHAPMGRLNTTFYDQKEHSP